MQRLYKGVSWCVCVGVYLVQLHSLIKYIYFGSGGSCPNGFGGNGISPTEKNTRYVASPLWNPIRQRAFHLTRYSRDSKLPGCTDRKLPPHHCSPQPTGFAWKFSYLCRYRLCGRAGFEIGQSVKIVEVLFVSRSTAENEHERNTYVEIVGEVYCICVIIPGASLHSALL